MRNCGTRQVTRRAGDPACCQRYWQPQMGSPVAGVRRFVKAMPAPDSQRLALAREFIEVTRPTRGPRSRALTGAAPLTGMQTCALLVVEMLEGLAARRLRPDGQPAKEAADHHGLLDRLRH